MPWTFSALWLSFRIGLLCSVIMVLQKRLQAVRLQDKPIYLCINIWIDARLLDICTYRYVISYNVSFFYYTVLLISLLSYTYLYIYTFIIRKPQETGIGPQDAPSLAIAAATAGQVPVLEFLKAATFVFQIKRNGFGV